MIKQIMKLFSRRRWQYASLEVTIRSRAERRQETCVVEGQEIKVIDYIRRTAKMMPRMIDTQTNKPVCHKTKLTEMHSRYGLKGINYYVDNVNSKSKRSIKTLKKA